MRLIRFVVFSPLFLASSAYAFGDMSQPGVGPGTLVSASSFTATDCIKTDSSGTQFQANCDNVQNVLIGTGGLFNAGQSITDGSATVKGAQGLLVNYHADLGSATVRAGLTVVGSATVQGTLSAQGANGVGVTYGVTAGTITASVSALIAELVTSGQTIVRGTATVSGAGGLGVTYGVTAGSFTGLGSALTGVPSSATVTAIMVSTGLSTVWQSTITPIIAAKMNTGDNIAVSQMDGSTYTAAIAPLFAWESTAAPKISYLDEWMSTASPKFVQFAAWQSTITPVTESLITWQSTSSPILQQFLDCESTMSPVAQSLVVWQSTASPKLAASEIWQSTITPVVAAKMDTGASINASQVDGSTYTAAINGRAAQGTNGDITGLTALRAVSLETTFAASVTFQGANGIQASTGTFAVVVATAVGNANYSILSSSGINMTAGTMQLNTGTLCFGANGCQTAPPGSGDIGGSGTTGTIPYFSAGTTLGNAPVTTDGNSILVAGVSSATAGDFTGIKSTTTFAGWVDIGLNIVEVDCGSTNECSATCPSGQRLLGGGCKGVYTGYEMDSGYPSTATTWRCSWGGENQHYAYAICARVK